MKGGHGQTNQLQDIKFGTLDHVSCVPHVVHYVRVHECVCVYMCNVSANTEKMDTTLYCDVC